MKPNLYVKIVDDGIENPVDGLYPFGSSDTIITIQDDEIVEVHSSILNLGNIIVIAARSGHEVRTVIHTPHTVYVQESNRTILTARPVSSLLFATDADGNMETVQDTIRTITLPKEFWEKASPELLEVAQLIIPVLGQCTDKILERAEKYDRFNITCRNNVGAQEEYAMLADAVYDATGYNLLPVSLHGTPYAIDCFYLERP